MDRVANMLAFARTVELGSFSAAADTLSLSPQMIGKQVRQLEDHLGLQLLNRTTRRQSLTDFGRAYYERVQHILAELESVEAFAAESLAQPRGLLRISAPLTFGAHALAKAVPDYVSLYPEVEIDLVLSDRVVDLIEDGIDVAFRVGKMADSSLVARSLKPMEPIVCAAPSYFIKKGRPAKPSDLAGHDILGFAHAIERMGWAFDGPSGREVVEVRSRFRANSGQALRALALAGMGIVLQPFDLVGDDIMDGRLVEVFQDYQAVTRPMHIVYPPHRRITPKLRSFIDFAVERFA